MAAYVKRYFRKFFKKVDFNNFDNEWSVGTATDTAAVSAVAAFAVVSVPAIISRTCSSALTRNG